MAQDRQLASDGPDTGRGWGHRIRRGLAVTALSGAIVVSGLATGSTRASAEPDTVSQAKQQLAALQKQSSSVEAAYTTAQDKLDTAQKSLKSAQKDLVGQRAKVASMRKALSSLAVNDYQSGGVSLTAQLVTSGDSGKFLSQLTTMQNVSDRTKSQFQTFQAEQARLQTLEKQAASDQATIKSSRDSQAALLKQAKAKETNAKSVVDSLSAQEKQRLAAQQAAETRSRTEQAEAATSRSEARTSAPASSTKAAPSAPSSGRASTAISFAMSKVGGPYVYGGTGPTGYDCSGLMQAAWAAAGVSIPRTAEEQIGAGTSVSKSELQPGDLVFFYGNPPSHVGMYIGNGKIVHAANPNSGIKTAPLGEMPYSGAVRVG